jgi:hemerythrin-like domain-containing protein
MARAFCALGPVAGRSRPGDNGRAMNAHEPQRQRCGCACDGANPIDILSHEHQTILSVLDLLYAQAEFLRSGAPVRPDFWQPVLDFLENYADRCHHAKEEHLLFSELEQSGLPGSYGPTACMRREHEMGRDLRLCMVQALQAEDARNLATAASDYASLLREHIEKEEGVLFPMARSLLDHDAMRRLRHGFMQVERVDLGEGAHERYEELARNLIAVHGQGAAI